MMIQRFRVLNGERGFTLPEMLIAMVIFGIVVAGIVAARISQQNQSMTQQQAIDVQQNVRAALSMMIYEIRMAGYNPDGGDYGEGILNAGVGTEADPFTFAYVADDDTIDNNGVGGADEKGELATISYFLQGSDLILNDGPLPLQATFDKLIAENISQLTFTYLDATNTATAVLNDIRAVSISITATTPSNELDRTDGQNNTRTLQTTVNCRNLGL